MVPVDELEQMPRRRSATIRALAWTVGAGILVAAGVLATRPAPDATTETLLPAFDLPRLDQPGTLSSDDLEGTPVVINFWASWCGPCIEEIPLFEAAWRDYRDRGLIVLGVNVQDRAEDARAFLEELGMTFPVVRDADQELARALELYGLPQTFFVRRDGTVVGTRRTGATASPGAGRVVLGAISRAELRAGIEDLLGDRAGAD